MRVMIVDGGARGQALAEKLYPECDEVVVSPGNPGNESFAESTGIAPADIAGQLAEACRRNVDLTVVGDDNALGQGIVDAFQERDKLIFGPTQEQARIETDRQYAKQIGRWRGVPMGPAAHFTDVCAAREYVLDRQWPVFVKDNDLAQGKGAVKCENIVELTEAAKRLTSFVIEDFVRGPEASMHSFCDGKTQLTIPFLVRDHKTIAENDTGAMTGGMGVVGPLPGYTALTVETLGERFATPIVHETGFRGLLFTGLKGQKRDEKTIEWNARWGDPETQVFLRLMKSPLLPVLMACVQGELADLQLPEWETNKAAVSLVLAAPGYPSKPRTGMIIDGIHRAEAYDVTVLHAATKRYGPDWLVTNGGRVLNIVAMADTLSGALNRAYAAAQEITFSGQSPLLRRDIGQSVIS